MIDLSYYGVYQPVAHYSSINKINNKQWLTTHITFYLIWEKVVDREGGGVRSNVVVGWFFICKVTDNCKILTFSPKKIIDSTLTQTVSSWLNSDSNDDQRDSTLTRLISLIFTADSTLTRLIWVRVESNLTHDSWVEHNPGCHLFLRTTPRSYKNRIWKKMS